MTKVHVSRLPRFFSSNGFESMLVQRRSYLAPSPAQETSSVNAHPRPPCLPTSPFALFFLFALHKGLDRRQLTFHTVNPTSHLSYAFLLCFLSSSSEKRKSFVRPLCLPRPSVGREPCDKVDDDKCIVCEDNFFLSPKIIERELLT